ncbi:NAD(P)H:quinone oxidoreductase [Actinoplanes sp. CA-142083]|uniref:NAD(P)H:quinone oxidoreductase n=1 Tax=Actinoplanes sp. CA-142083 TaxID=3239903 RepID=UPI003D8CFDE2
MTANVAVIYYSATGSVHALARAVAEGATEAGAQVRLRRVAETPFADIPPAAVEDLAWADAYAFGTPSRFGTPAAPLKHFIDEAVGLWQEGALADKAATAFTSAHNRHGGSEATLLSLANVFYHWGAVIVPPGYTDPAVYAAGGNPYGTTAVSGPAGEDLQTAALDAARYQGQRLARTAMLLRAGSEMLAGTAVHA